MIVDRLRIAAKSCDFMALPHNAGTCYAAADEIERLTAEVERLRELFLVIRHDHIKYPQLRLPKMQANRVDTALTQQEHSDE